MEKERMFVCIKSEGNETLVGIDVEKRNVDGRFQTVASLRAEINGVSHKAVIKKDKSTTKEQNFEGYYKCEKQFGILAKDLGVKEIIDERELVDNKNELKNTNENVSAF